VVPAGEEAGLCELLPDKNDGLVPGAEFAAVYPSPPVPGPVPEPEARRVPGGKEVRAVLDERAVPDAVPERAEEDDRVRGVGEYRLAISAGVQPAVSRMGYCESRDPEFWCLTSPGAAGREVSSGPVFPPGGVGSRVAPGPGPGDCGLLRGCMPAGGSVGISGRRAAFCPVSHPCTGFFLP